MTYNIILKILLRAQLFLSSFDFQYSQRTYRTTYWWFYMFDSILKYTFEAGRNVLIYLGYLNIMRDLEDAQYRNKMQIYRRTIFCEWMTLRFISLDFLLKDVSSIFIIIHSIFIKFSLTLKLNAYKFLFTSAGKKFLYANLQECAREQCYQNKHWRNKFTMTPQIICGRHKCNSQKI